MFPNSSIEDGKPSVVCVMFCENFSIAFSRSAISQHFSEVMKQLELRSPAMPLAPSSLSSFPQQSWCGSVPNIHSQASEDSGDKRVSDHGKYPLVVRISQLSILFAYVAYHTQYEPLAWFLHPFTFSILLSRSIMFI